MKETYTESEQRVRLVLKINHPQLCFKLHTVSLSTVVCFLIKKMSVVWIAVLIMVAETIAAPAVKYDQRQEGDVNVRADLENFVILIIPTSNSNSLGLLDLLTKAIPNKSALKKRTEHLKKPIISTEEDTQHFIESKTAPYHVDISRTRSHLAKLHPQLKIADKGEVLIAHSPIVSLTKTPEDPEERRSRNILINKNEDVKALILTSDIAVDLQKPRIEATKRKDSGELLLLGSELVQCGPDQRRDSNGICQMIKN